MLQQDFFSNIQYRNVDLSQMEIEIGDENALLMAPARGEKPLILSDTAFYHLMMYLGVPQGFANKLKSKKQTNVLSYLQKQLSQTVSEKSILMVTDKDEQILCFSEESFIPFPGMKAVEADERILELLSEPDCQLTLRKVQNLEGEIAYSFVRKDEYALEADTDPMWRWGYEFRHSVIGSEDAYFSSSAERMVCSNLTYLPLKTFVHPIAHHETVEGRWDQVADFLRSPPEANWDQVNAWIKKLAKKQASLREVKDVRNQLHNLLMADAEDTENKYRVDKALEWHTIIDAFKISELDFKPTANWYAQAATPINLFDLYNILTREATHAPTHVDEKTRQDVLAFAGRILTKTPDLEEFPPVINWDQVRAEAKRELN